jgi:hypothetical protein
MPPMAKTLPDDPSTLKALLIAERVQNERLLQIIKELQRHRFGRKAETLPEDQMLLGLEEVEQIEAAGKAKEEARSELESRKVVDRAKGILMKSRGLTEEAAYTLLRKTAMNQNRKISDIAQCLVTAAGLLGPLEDE